MNLIEKHMIVKILSKGKDPKNIIYGTVLYSIDVTGTKYWWVETIDGAIRDVTPFLESDLIEWNYGHLALPAKKCTCGSDSVGHPGHGFLCPKYEKNPYD